MDYEKKYKDNVIDIPFGAKDSELKGWEYTIPEGMEAEIKDGKVIVKEKESDDERIRKALIDEIKVWDEHYKLFEHVSKEKFLAYLEKQKINTEGDFARGYDCGYECCLHSHVAEWLEKQKESLHITETCKENANSFTDEDERIRNLLRRIVITANNGDLQILGDNDTKKCLAYLEKQKDKQNLIEKSLDSYMTDPDGYLKDWSNAYDKGFEAAKELFVAQPEKYGLQKPAQWSEDKKDKVAQYLHDMDGGMLWSKATEITSDILDILRPQPKQEWSEEDEKFAYFVNQFLGYYENSDPTAMSCKKWFNNRLKSLRPQSKEELAKMLQDEYNNGKELGEREGYTKGYNKGYEDAKNANEAVSYRFPVMPTTPVFGCDGTHCTNPQMDCINCPRKLTGGMFNINTTSSSGDPTLKAEWKPSEQEKGALRNAIFILTEDRNFPKMAAQLQNILDAFEGKESRKDWKPSEEQMEALGYAVTGDFDKIKPTSYLSRRLEEMEGKLKKLM